MSVPLPLQLLAMATLTTIVLVEDHDVVRDGLVAILKNMPDCELLCAVKTGSEALAAAERLSPDLMLLDLQLPDMSGLEVMRVLRTKPARPLFMVLTSFDGDHTIRQAIDLGATGYFIKSGGWDALSAALRIVIAGGRYLAAHATEQLMEHLNSEAITPREVQILRFASFGLSNQQIADELGIKERAVKLHFKTLFGKLNVSDRTSAVVTALRRGILHS